MGYALNVREETLTRFANAVIIVRIIRYRFHSYIKAYVYTSVVLSKAGKYEGSGVAFDKPRAVCVKEEEEVTRGL